jgi:hypothetical protein
MVVLLMAVLALLAAAWVLAPLWRPVCPTPAGPAGAPQIDAGIGMGSGGHPA